MNKLPEKIASVDILEELLSRPDMELVEMMKRLDGDIIILGISGKVGMTLGMRAVRAIEMAGVRKKVYGVSRFSQQENKAKLSAMGIEPISCDLLDAAAVKRLPQVPNVIFMAGRKFGTEGSQALTWAMNTLPAAYAGEHYKDSRIVAFSTGCVYPLVGPETCGCSEDVPPSPIGDYSQSCLARERIFEYCAAQYGTKVLLFRLNYAVDLRYGVLNDIGRNIWEGRPVDLNVGHFNVIWQGNVVSNALKCLEHCSTDCPAMNITGPEMASVRKTALAMGRIMGKEPIFTGEEGTKCYLNDASKMCSIFGYPEVSLEQMVQWQAHWIKDGGLCIGKPTHFEVSNGQF